jgi:hypothetical protein
MMGYWLDKVLGDNDDGNNLAKFAPLVIFFVIWLFGAIAKARSGKKGTETESSQVDKEVADKIRERYAKAKEQAKIEAQQGINEQFMPPARTPQPKPPPPRRPESAPDKKPVAPPIYSQEGPTLKVVDGLEWASVGTPITVEKPTLQKVEPNLQKVDAITSENAKVSGEVEIHQQHPYLAELAGQYATQDGFRKAILNYEILGPPLALRE